jgi:hypothetical protein
MGCPDGHSSFTFAFDSGDRNDTAFSKVSLDVLDMVNLVDLNDVIEIQLSSVNPKKSPSVDAIKSQQPDVYRPAITPSA